MRTLRIEPWTEPADLYGFNAQDDHGTLVDGPCRVYLNDDSLPTIVYGTLPDAPDPQFLRLLQDGPYRVQSRSAGMVTRSFTFGFNPRMPTRAREFCQPCQANRSHPLLAEHLERLALTMEHAFQAEQPVQFAVQAGHVHSIDPAWRLTGSQVFTGGIVNQNAALPYHVDGGNFAGSWNVMAVWREDTSGGHLVLAGPRLRFPMEHNTFLLFPAQDHYHGVTPIVKTRRTGYRVSAVWFATRALQRCLPLADELRYAQAKRTEREQRRAGLIA